MYSLIGPPTLEIDSSMNWSTPEKFPMRRWSELTCVPEPTSPTASPPSMWMTVGVTPVACLPVITQSGPSGPSACSKVSVKGTQVPVRSKSSDHSVSIAAPPWWTLSVTISTYWSPT